MVETCAQIRAQIGALPPADPGLLRKLAARKDCLFAPNEVYRAAYGNRSLPEPDPERQRRRGDDGDDD